MRLFEVKNLLVISKKVFDIRSSVMISLQALSP